MNFYNILSSSKQLNNHTSFYDILFLRRLSSRVSQYLWYKLWGNTRQGVLPTGYTQVDYIESSGTQYIDTGAIANNNSRLFVDFQLTQIDTSRGIAGQFFTNNKRFQIYQSGTLNTITLGIGDANATVPSSLDRYKITLDAINLKAYVNNEDVSSSSYTRNISGNKSIYLFTSNQSNLAFSSMKLYNSKIWDNDVLVRNFIPCYRKSDNEVGLYDTVNDVFYTNQGTGSFAYGNVVPTPSAPVPVLGVGDRTENLLNYHYLFTPDYDRHSTYFDYYKLMLEPSTQYTFTTNATSTSDATTFLVGTANVMGTSNDGLFNGVAKTITSNPDGSIYIARRIAKLSSLPILPESDFDNGVYYIMLNTGSTPLPYEPYGYKISLDCDSEIKNIYLNEPLHKINDYADVLSYSEHNVVRKIKKRVFDGTENWSEAAAIKAYRFAIKIGDATQSDLTAGVRSICTHFSLVATGQTYNVDNCYTIAQDKNFVCRLDGSVRLADFKAFLAQQYANGTPVTLWYVSTTPVTEQIKATDILANKYTSITVDTEVQPSQVDFTTKGKKVPQPTRETVRMLNSANTANQVNAINSIDMLNQSEELMTSEAEPSDNLIEGTKAELEEQPSQTDFIIK